MERDARGDWLPCKLCGDARPHGHKWGIGVPLYWSPERIEADIASRAHLRTTDGLEYCDN